MQLFIDDEIFHRHARGGVSRYLCELAAAAARQEDVKVVLFGGWCQSQVIRQVRPTPTLMVVYRPRDTKLRLNGLARLLSTFWRRRAFAAALRADPDTVYHPGLYTADRWIAARAAGLVVTVHDLQLEIQGTHSRSRAREVAQKRAIVAVADHIFCPSQSTADDLQRLLPAAQGKVSVVHLGADLVPPSTPPPPEAPYFLMVGSRHGHKNGRVALEAFAAVAAEHPDLRLKLCGGAEPGTGGELDFLGAAAVRARLDWVKLDDAGLAAAYAGARALLYPSNYEGFGLPVLEALRCGCPVVTTSVSSLPEVGGDAALYLTPGDTGAMTAHLRRLLTDGEFRRGCIARGHAQAEKFSWDKTAARVVAGCRAVLAARRG